jgi:TfoX/Sxy family transcriptional regulator of competence genes
MAKKREAPTIPAEKRTRYEAIVATIPGLKCKGATMPYTAVNGHMFSFLTQDGSLALRLPLQTREAFLRKFKTTLVEAHGTVMKEYVAVPDALWQTVDEMKLYFDLSYQYVQTLKPKKQPDASGDK